MSTDLLEMLPEWLPHQRWFGAKGRQIHGVSIVAERTLVDGALGCRHVLAEVDLGEDKQIYQLLVGARQQLPERLTHAQIGVSGDEQLYDGLHDNELTNVLLQLLAVQADEQGLRFRHLTEVDLRTDLTGIVMSAEQSNTPVGFGDDYILKLFRKVAPGLNPDLEITRALAEAGCTSIVPPLSWLETHLGSESTTLGMMQPFLRSASEGWQLAVTSVRDLYAEADLHADEVGGDFAAGSERLAAARAGGPGGPGAGRAEVDSLLREVLPAGLAGAEENVATAKRRHERLDAAL